MLGRPGDRGHANRRRIEIDGVEVDGPSGPASGPCRTALTQFIAAFRMYQRPELYPVFDSLWRVTRDLLRARGIGAPEALTVIDSDLLSLWQRPDLLLSQACGHPFWHCLRGRVALVGSPNFGLEACAPGHYRSALVVRRDEPRQNLTDFRGATIVCNDLHSHSATPRRCLRRIALACSSVRC